MESTRVEDVWCLGSVGQGVRRASLAARPKKKTMKMSLTRKWKVTWAGPGRGVGGGNLVSTRGGGEVYGGDEGSGGEGGGEGRGEGGGGSEGGDARAGGMRCVWRRI